MFKEFSRCSRKGFILSLVTGGTIILCAAGLLLLSGNILFLKAGFIVGLICARLAEVIYSRSCPWSKAGLESLVLALTGVVLVAVDEYFLTLTA